MSLLKRRIEASPTRALVTGGAGFIGWFTVRELAEAGHQVFALDDYSAPSAPADEPSISWLEGDANDEACLERVIRATQPDVVVHLMGVHSTEDSEADPITYYQRNAGSVSRLLRACLRNGVGRIVASSTSLVYESARPDAALTEADPLNPKSPYARSKLALEWMLEDARAAFGLRFLALRYFNVAGASSDGSRGRGDRSTAHLVKAMAAAAAGRRPPLTIAVERGARAAGYDGTAIRDYVHVEDVARANRMAVEALAERDLGETLNVGSGAGRSTLEMLALAEAEFGRAVPHVLKETDEPFVRRLVADVSRAKETLGWAPRMTTRDVLRHAWAWENALAKRASGSVDRLERDCPHAEDRARGPSPLDV